MKPLAGFLVTGQFRVLGLPGMHFLENTAEFICGEDLGEAGKFKAIR